MTFETEVRPRLNGDCTLVRFADDALMAAYCCPCAPGAVIDGDLHKDSKCRSVPTCGKDAKKHAALPPGSRRISGTGTAHLPRSVATGPRHGGQRPYRSG
jgi:hypothetical protein